MSEHPLKQDDYGFYCDLESIEDDVEYYVVTTRTHYEVRRKLKNTTKINGLQRTNIINLASAKSSTENLNQDCVKGKSQNVCSFIINFPTDVFYSICVCFTTCSCLYLIVNTQNI